MNPRTDSGRATSEFSPSYLQLLVSIAGATLVLVFAFERLFSRDLYLLAYFVPFPWIIAAGQTIADGLALFSGKSPEVVSTGHRLAMLADILIVFVVGPTLLLMSWRNRRIVREQPEKASTRGLWTLLFVVGGMISFSVIIPAVPIAIIQRNVASSLYHAQAVQRNKDFMINDLNVLAFSARQYRILPKPLGGGEGSYAGFIPSNEIGSTENGAYVVSTSTNQCVIKGTSKLYPSAGVSVVVNEVGQLRDWSYTGPFE